MKGPVAKKNYEGALHNSSLGALIWGLVKKNYEGALHNSSLGGLIWGLAKKNYEGALHISSLGGVIWGLAKLEMASPRFLVFLLWKRFARQQGPLQEIIPENIFDFF